MYVRFAWVALVAAFAAALALGAQQEPQHEPQHEQGPAPPAAPASETPTATPPSDEAAPSGPLHRPVPSGPDHFVVPVGTRVPLSMINSVSTKTAVAGERVYLESVFPILVDGHVIIPPGSYVAGTVTDVKRPGRVKGRGELYVRFDSLTLPNGVTRDFRARLGNLDGRAPETLDKSEGKIKGEGDKSGDVKTVGEGAGIGATIGGLAGAAAGHGVMGAGLGAAAGAAAGLAAVLLTRGPDAILSKGTTVEMVLDRPLQFSPTDIDFRNQMPRAQSSDGPGPQPSRKLQDRGRWPVP